MLTKALLVLPVLALSCAGTGSNAAAPSRAPAASSPAVSTPTVPAGAVIVRGGFAQLVFKKSRGGGFLRVEVKSTQSATGATVVEAKYQRSAGCKPDPVNERDNLALCETLWTVTQKLKPEAFVFDETLATATLTDTVKGKALRVTWQGVGDTRRQPNANGHLLVEMRDAKGTVQWGADRYTDPAGTQEPSQLYRRISPKA